MPNRWMSSILAMDGPGLSLALSWRLSVDTDQGREEVHKDRQGKRLPIQTIHRPVHRFGRQTGSLPRSARLLAYWVCGRPQGRYSRGGAETTPWSARCLCTGECGAASGGHA